MYIYFFALARIVSRPLGSSKNEENYYFFSLDAVFCVLEFTLRPEIILGPWAQKYTLRFHEEKTVSYHGLK